MHASSLERRAPLVGMLAAAVLSAACSGPGDLAEAAPSAGDWTLVSGGAIWASAEAREPVDAVLARDGVVVALGTAEEVLTALPDGAEATRVDLAGAVGVPGLVDAHGHLFNLGLQLESVDLAGCDSYQELVRRVAAAASELPPGTWIRGRGWDQTRWPENAFPHHAELSAAVPEHPVLLSRVDGHAALANARALALAGLDRAFDEPPAVEGGRVVLGADGRPTGVLVDTAAGLVQRVVPPDDAATLTRRALLAQEALLAVGLVGVHEMGLGAAELDVLESLARDGRLRLRVVGYLWGNEPVAPELLARYPGERDRDPASRLRIVGAKLMLDGAMGSRGAALLEPYSDAPGERGLLRMDAAAFAARLDEVVDAGLQPATHAIGDRANRLVLDAYEARLRADAEFAGLRPRVEHAQLVAPSDLARFAALGVVPSMQPTHCTSDMRWVEQRVGAERARGAYAWQTLGDARAPLALGSDFPVERPHPLEGLYAATTRQDAAGAPPGGWHPEERLDARAALAGFTVGAAYAAGEERLRGELRPGAALDLSAFDVDPLRAPASALLGGAARLVLIDGRVEYAR